MFVTEEMGAYCSFWSCGGQSLDALSDTEYFYPLETWSVDFWSGPEGWERSQTAHTSVAVKCWSIIQSRSIADPETKISGITVGDRHMSK